MEEHIGSTDHRSRKQWIKPQLEVLDMGHTYAEDSYWEFKEYNGFWIRNQVSLVPES